MPLRAALPVPFGPQPGGQQRGEARRPVPHRLVAEEVLPMDTVDNSAELLERAPGRAGQAPARRSGTTIRRGRALMPVDTRIIVGSCAAFVAAGPARAPRP